MDDLGLIFLLAHLANTSFTERKEYALNPFHIDQMVNDNAFEFGSLSYRPEFVLLCGHIYHIQKYMEIHLFTFPFISYIQYW
jgi:hypothetical protein